MQIFVLLCEFMILIALPFLFFSGPGKYPGNCSFSGSCNSSAKGCRGSEFDEDEAEKVKTFLRSVAKILE